MDTFEEHSKTGPDYCRLLSGEIICETYSWLPGVVLVLNDSAGEAIDAGQTDAVEIERRAIELREGSRVEGTV